MLRLRIIGACEQCGTVMNLSVEQLIRFMDLVDKFDKLKLNPEFMKEFNENEKWRNFYRENQVGGPSSSSRNRRTYVCSAGVQNPLPELYYSHKWGLLHVIHCMLRC